MNLKDYTGTFRIKSDAELHLEPLDHFTIVEFV